MLRLLGSSGRIMGLIKQAQDMLPHLIHIMSCKVFELLTGSSDSACLGAAFDLGTQLNHPHDCALFHASSMIYFCEMGHDCGRT